MQTSILSESNQPDEPGSCPVWHGASPAFGKKKQNRVVIGGLEAPKSALSPCRACAGHTPSDATSSQHSSRLRLTQLNAPSGRSTAPAPRSPRPHWSHSSLSKYLAVLIGRLPLAQRLWHCARAGRRGLTTELKIPLLAGCLLLLLMTCHYHRKTRPLLACKVFNHDCWFFANAAVRRTQLSQLGTLPEVACANFQCGAATFQPKRHALC